MSFTGRDEDISDEDRVKQRYTLSHLAHDIKTQSGITEPMRGLVPALGDGALQRPHRHAPRRDGRLGLDEVRLPSELRHRHGDLRQQEDQASDPVTEFLDMEGLLNDIQDITDAAQNKPITLAEVGLAMLKNFDADKAPVSFPVLMKQFLSQTGARGKKIGEHESDAHEFDWRILFVAGMWFQDLFNYDFRRTEMCIIPYGTQMGEISFCAYNTGVGWRQILEKMKATASVAEWNRTRGRHAVYAKGQDLEVPPSLGTIVVEKSVATPTERARVRLRVLET